MTDGDLSATFGGWSDRLTYLMAHSKILAVVALVGVGFGIWHFNVQLPGIPSWVMHLIGGTFILYPPSVFFGLRVAGWLRNRQYVEVYHVKYPDVLGHYFVPPELWTQKEVDGPAPHRINDGDAVVVREWEYAPEYGEHGQLTVSGVQLSEMEDGKLFTSRKHAERIYEELVDSHLSLIYLRDSMDDFAADLQERIINRLSEAREQGEHLDPSAVREVMDDFKERAERVTEDQLTDLHPDDVAEWGEMPALPAGETTHPYADPNADHTRASGDSGAAAADGGTDA